MSKVVWHHVMKEVDRKYDHECSTITDDRREVVRAFAEWLDDHGASKVYSIDVDHFIRTYLGGEQC